MTLDGLILNAIHGLMLVLTPSERWQAARMQQPGQLTNRWFVLVCAIVLVVLTVLLFWVSLHRIRQEQRINDRALFDMAQQKALTLRECQILQHIGKCSGMRRKQAVFSSRLAFDRGAAKMIEQILSTKGSQEKQQVITEVSLLREKIGFGKDLATLRTTHSRSLSSRQIPVGKQVTLLPVPVGDTKAIEAVIHCNTEYELSVQLQASIKVTFGGRWTVRYFFGASVWEFETSVISYDGTILVLAHSDHVGFVNRRRFVRAPVVRRALVAKFPFEQAIELSDTVTKTKNSRKKVAPVHPIDQHGLPEFIPATLVELGGPGLRIKTSLDVKTGDRVLVVFDLEIEPPVSEDSAYLTRQTRLIEDIGEVRHVRRMEDGVSLAVELYGLKDDDVNELIRATNAALIKTKERPQAPKAGKSQTMIQEVSA
jgi:hypothetical protein